MELNMKYDIITLDVGYGDCKVIAGNESGIVKQYKFPSVVAKVKANPLVNDSRIIEFEKESYYVGADALSVQSDAIIDISNYARLEFFTPLFIYKVFCDLESAAHKLVLGLSIAQIGNSGHYKARVEKFLQSLGLDIQVIIVPQGAISKLAIDEYGVSFPDKSKEYKSDSNYVIADIGFNTLDLTQVIAGKTSANLVRGIESSGAVLIVNQMVKEIKDQLGIELNLSEGKEVLSQGYIKRRGKKTDVKEIIKVAVDRYMSDLKMVIEAEFGKILDKVDNLIIVGGGSYLLKEMDTEDGFIIKPAQYAEFYNTIGFYLKGKEQ